MTEKIYHTNKGPIHYWVSDGMVLAPQLVFLPGLTADHRLFDKQITYFRKIFRIFVWDAPGHASSHPFEMTFSLKDKARWLHEILKKEGFNDPVIIGQSMGGFLGQMYLQLYPSEPRGFISIDSTPLKKEYFKKWELWVLDRTEPMYLSYPWKKLLKDGSDGVAESEYGRDLMRSMMMEYDSDRKRYARLAGHGYRMVVGAVEADLPYEIKCPALLICGDKDRAAFTKRYNKAWHEKSGIPIEWIAGAGHNSNTDEPDQVNHLIEDFISQLTI